MRKDRNPDTIDLTPEMIAAGAAVLWDALGESEIGPTGAERLAEAVLSAGLGTLSLTRLKVTEAT
jgi:hypothetical protein